MSVTRNPIEMPAGQARQSSFESRSLLVAEKPPARAKSDRRRASRVSVMAAVRVLDVHSGVELQGRVTDLSMSGCYIDIMNPLPAGAQIRIRITYHGKTFDAVAKVANTQPGMGMGVAFAKAEPEHVKTLREWMAELKTHAN